jgi:hypothetical protein
MVEEPVGVDLAHGLLDGLGAEGTSDLFEGEELVARGVFDEVDIRKAALLERNRQRQLLLLLSYVFSCAPEQFKREGRVSFAHLAQQSLDLETPAVNLESRRSREAIQAIAKRIKQIRQYLRHGEDFWVNNAPKTTKTTR